MKKSEFKAMVKQYTLEALHEVLSGVDFENLVSEAIKQKKPANGDLREMVVVGKKIQEGLIPRPQKQTKIFSDPLLNQLAEDTIKSGHKVVVDESKDENSESGGISESVMESMGLFNKDYSKLLG